MRVGDVVSVNSKFVVNPLTADTLVMRGQGLDLVLYVGQRGITMAVEGVDGEPIGPYIVTWVEAELAHLTPEDTYNVLAKS